ncbi:MAG: A/G-specific adenine glycosylase [Spirosomataceae bacterium]
MNNKFFADKLIRWYHQQHRDLPWRHTRDPYKIWLSEIILQQTRVAQGLPYYEQFVKNYPTILDLANASQQEVIRLWQGLGYYSRARNLHQTAQYIASQLQGVFPQTYVELLKLKGIGPYTAAAIASFAFNEAVAVVDGNVYRVLARVFGIETDIGSAQGQKQFAELASQLIPNDQPAIYNQAIMEFGALHCTPTSPDCLLCPLQEICVANATSRINQLPVKAKKIKVKQRFFNYFVIIQGGKVAMQKRTKRDIWQDLYEFYLVESEKPITTLDDLPDNPLLKVVLDQSIVSIPTGIYTHILTHQRILAQFWIFQVPLGISLDLPATLSFLTVSEIERMPKPVLISNYLESINGFL